ncbi:hypothetical protein BVRB_4g089920 isoform A [Beta vulgaris subsp. vulgaris]|nr:hypothetical protein BVRB_4g089920 isoform A [Beta vulgaris subsp. vulgaris]
MKSCEPNLKNQCQQNGTAYIVIREDKNVNELGNNVPSLVPYDYSEEEDEKEQIEDETQEFPGPVYDSEDYVSDHELNSVYYDSLRSDSPDCYKMHEGPEEYNIWVVDKNCDDSHCIDILKDNGCESCFLKGVKYFPGIFSAKLDKEQVKKLEGDSRVRLLRIADDMCCD